MDVSENHFIEYPTDPRPYNFESKSARSQVSGNINEPIIDPYLIGLREEIEFTTEP